MEGPLDRSKWSDWKYEKGLKLGEKPGTWSAWLVPLFNNQQVDTNPMDLCGVVSALESIFNLVQAGISSAGFCY
jgi:hypothetical protein